MLLLNVLQQVALFVEWFVTVVALIVFNSQVNCVEMRLQIILVRSFKIAHITVVGFETRVILFMMIKFTLELETLVTLITFKRSLIGMIADNVRLEVIFARAAKFTLITLKRFFSWIAIIQAFSDKLKDLQWSAIDFELQKEKFSRKKERSLFPFCEKWNISSCFWEKFECSEKSKNKTNLSYRESENGILTVRS